VFLREKCDFFMYKYQIGNYNLFAFSPPPHVVIMFVMYILYYIILLLINYYVKAHDIEDMSFFFF